MAEYPFQEIEKKWQEHWKTNKTFETKEESGKPKYYVLDMFPYPSGAGLHVGHPLGYIATDIVARYKRLKGFNVLHPMGFDSFGLPAEQYAIKTGTHPAKTTAENIARFKEQLAVLGFSYDWDKEVWTSNPDYYKWSQWIFLKLFEQGLAYESDALINWCPNDRTVLANEEVKNGACERCGQPVIRRKMRQWILKITEYADRLLEDLDLLDWPESIKLSQANWIGKSHGAEIAFPLLEGDGEVKVYTTRPDTIYGVTYMVLSPEHPLVQKITTEDKKGSVEEYVMQASLKSDLERAELDKSKTGVFTGAYVKNPINGEQIPIWISDYVLISYGTGAIMAVPGGDERDFEFAQKFNLPIIQVVRPAGTDKPKEVEFYPGHGTIMNSGEYDGMDSQEFTKTIIERIEKENHGKGAVNYKLRDWIFTRQRYWGEPIPVIHCDDCGVVPVPENQLPVVLPDVESYTPTEEGDSPLAKVEDWVNTTCPKCGKAAKRETNTMPQWAGSCWYYLRYIDPKNDTQLVDKDKEKYWMNVDLYVGGAEHAVLHLLYARFWHKVLYDLGYVSTKEPFQKLVNQGMIQGRSNFVYRVKGENKYVSHGLRKGFDVSTLHVDISIVENDELDTTAFKKQGPSFKDAEFILEDGKYICGWEVEKMSKGKYNVVNPDTVVNKYGADTMRLYEMFLGPLEQFKPWNTQGIDGVFKFLRRLWNLFHEDDGSFVVSDEPATEEELKVLHKAIQKAEYDVVHLSFNTSVSAFMICINDLMALKCNKRQILESLTLIVSPYAPHICEELWEKLGYSEGISYALFPELDEKYLQEDTYEYPVSVNGKMRAKMKFALDMPKANIEKQVLASEIIQKWTEGKQPKKVIVVPNKIVNVVV
ncbi:MAG: leucine--tRNA ligase [Cyclobacteriaceae bacterium]